MQSDVIQRTAVDLDGLLEILGKNLYSSPHVALRELIQNASDACERHNIEDKQARKYRIDVECIPEESILKISDNGSGLTRQELGDYLATIGSGYSREIRNRTSTKDVIGYFGLGFLSAYVVAKKVEVVTRSYQTPKEAWTFMSAKGKTYSVSSGDRPNIGTTVTLFLDDEYQELSFPETISALLRKYCCLLQIPIHLNRSAEPENALEAPWHIDSYAPVIRKRTRAIKFASLFEGSFEPITTFSIPDGNKLGLKGLIWIQGGSSYSTSDNRNISVFNRNMFITDEDKELFPRWAGFFGAVLESKMFEPTASRESLQRNKYYQDVQSYLMEFLAASLRELVLEEPESWRRVLSRHNQALLGAAVSDDRLFETTHRALKVPTTDGDMTLPVLLSKSNQKIHIKTSSEVGHEEILFRAKGVPLVKGYLFGARGFCEKHHSFFGTKIERLGSKASRNSAFQHLTAENEKRFAELRGLFETENHDVQLTCFDPAHIPLLVIENSEIVLKKEIESDNADKRISGAALSLARIETAQTTSEKERTIFINTSNELVEELLRSDDVKKKHVRNLLVSLLEFLCLDSSNLDQPLDVVFTQFSNSILALLKRGEQ